MKMDKILPFTKNLLKKAVKSGEIVVDATVGNGHDTLFLAELVGESGRVFGFDVQEQAISATKERLSQYGYLERVTIFHTGHEQLEKMIPSEYHGKITGAVFNLGYLPNSDKSIFTRPESTISAVEQMISVLAPEGIIVLVIYHGFPEGAVERDALLSYCQQIDQKTAHVLKYQYINQQNNPPFIIAIEKI
ncbi:class I SAM-dependent methyltransferase [Neobacillus sp. FSL H8-0543]|uniref:class I SAM-dependent methyltransferase n=1 Tax=Neobacillus sp. FSL H8-0543 TaxID=2954672 RepID=UPI00315816A5